MVDGRAITAHGKVGMSLEIQTCKCQNYKNTMKFAMHVITEYKQQLGKLLFVFAGSRLIYIQAALRNRRPISSHATSKMPPICKSDVLLSPFHDVLMLRHLLHWH